ncbi:MAG: uroporphyrinogen decarboxylase [Gammaproteobacteria bacterium]|nr:MAG: uroporphyrinogen decarboxylase [Gammaproteobacteria bacterium]RLA54862.1 MAG: uroporphyrinogen decarboxylase [Gammaproteobacteria bacterium]
MSDLKNDRLLRALLREPVDVTPVWVMRQAGRYLPEYRAKRKRAGDFMALCQNPQAACEVTIQPLDRFDLDAAILFSDILTIPDAMGLGLYFEEGEGPRFRKPVRSAKDIEELTPVNTTSDLPYVLDAIRLIRSELNGRVPLIGFSGSPWTLATYMIEGGSSKDFARIKTMAYSNPALLSVLLEKLAVSVTDYLNAQIMAGAQAVQIFDTWGGVLSGKAYREFSLKYMARIVAGLNTQAEGRTVPVILFTKGGGGWLEAIAATGCQAIGLDWCQDIGEARARVGDRVALQGNMDPAVLRASTTAIEAEVATILQSYGQGAGHVFNLGHGVTPDIDPQQVAAFVDAVHSMSVNYH